ncbi:MAG: trans-aconitate 2-methyltransferase [Curvibacter sp.]|nr:trans-aconitate 2-methyltransferase [Curvibacter sp.]
MSWSARQYSSFEQERTRPVRDLVAAIPTQQVRLAVDLGCGPGNSTEVLVQRYAQARVIGLDNSEDMLEAARQRLPGLRFEHTDIGRWHPDERFDVILANASLQWLPAHQSLYPRLAGLLAPGGSLAIQTPDNLEEPSHRLLRELAASPAWAARIGGVRLEARHAASDYYQWLRPHCRQLDVWRTTYHHALAGGAAAVVEWFKGSALRPYLAPLEAAEQAAFLAQYQEAVARAYPTLDDGSVLLPFPRLFIMASQ